MLSYDKLSSVYSLFYWQVILVYSFLVASYAYLLVCLADYFCFAN